MSKRTAITIAEENLKYLQSLKRGTYSEVINQILWFMDEKNLTVDQLKEMYWLNQSFQNGVIPNNIKTQEVAKAKTQDIPAAEEVEIVEPEVQKQEVAIKEPEVQEIEVQEPEVKEPEAQESEAEEKPKIGRLDAMVYDDDMKSSLKAFDEEYQ